MKEDWTEQLRRKLEGHQMPPPDGLWESISEEMGLTANSVCRQPVIRRWYWAAAAAVLALVGFFVFNRQNEKFEVKNDKYENRQDEKMERRDDNLKRNKRYDNQTIGKSSIAQIDKTQWHKEPVTQNEEEPAQTEQLVLLPDSSKDLEMRAESSDVHTIAESNGLQSNHISHFSSSTSHLNKWSLGVNASGGLLAANTSQRTIFSYQQYYNAQTGTYSINTEVFGISDITFDSYTIMEYVSEHHLPIRFGLSVNYQLTPHLALHSGINYTYLYSKFSMPLYQNATFNQKLHYLGIPLGMTWQLWSVNHFLFYVSGGAMLEKCVRADLEGNGTISKKPWQWSVEAAVGAEYTFIPQLGFYLEPSLGYYFDDNTSLEHYYKEHPLAPSIEFGLRLHITK
jgi:hypothetical protein